ncbi:DUF4181 domain-containing protein [Neobacillus soli]|uniref:DUF4181 domain-containing protein n=1 Tax=Neobacillus soli TaxID=220688 RepID=UPI0009FF5CC5
MDFKRLLLFFIPWLLYFFLSEYILRKKLHIKKQNRWIYRSVNNTHKMAEIGLIIVFILTNSILGWFFPSTFKYGLFIFLCALYAIRSFMEWKYDRPTREYIITFWSFCGMCVFTVSTFIFL